MTEQSKFQGNLFREFISDFVQVHRHCYKYRDVKGKETMQLGCLRLKVFPSHIM